MVLPHQLCVREASRSRRVTLGFLPSLSLRNEKRPCSPEAKCVVWPRQSAHSSDVAQPATDSASPAIASRLSFRMLFILFVLRLCKLQATRYPRDSWALSAFSVPGMEERPRSPHARKFCTFAEGAGPATGGAGLNYRVESPRVGIFVPWRGLLTGSVSGNVRTSRDRGRARR